MLWTLISLLGILIFYCSRNDSILGKHPDAEALSPDRWTAGDVDRLVAAESEAEKDQGEGGEGIPPKTGRRYIVTGGSGFVGGHIVSTLLHRGESPQNIRILDIRPPTRRDLLAKEVGFIKVDITNPKGVLSAFEAPWPEGSSLESEITVFHTAANIRFFERSPLFLSRSSKINVDGTRNVIEASLAVGATILLATSSCTLGTFRQRLLLWPWESAVRPVQVLGDEEGNFPKRYEDAGSNYTWTKLLADRLVLSADGSVSPTHKSKVLRTGTLRIGAMVYGPGGNVFEHTLVNGGTFIFMHDFFIGMCFVGNSTLGHLLFEERLVELASTSARPDIGGQGFMITDPNPPVLGLDLYTTLDKMTGQKLWYIYISPTFLILISHLIEFIYIIQEVAHLYLPRWLRWVVPKVIRGDLVNMQPSLFNASYTVFVDDSKARMPVEKGGLGYKARWGSLEGVYKSWIEFRDNGTLEPLESVKGRAFGNASR